MHDVYSEEPGNAQEPTAGSNARKRQVQEAVPRKQESIPHRDKAKHKKHPAYMASKQATQQLQQITPVCRQPPTCI